MIRAGVVGATGYVGAELVRWIGLHPRFSLEAVTSRSAVGQRIDEVLPGLTGLCELPLQAFDAEALAALDVVFLATPHGAATPLAESLDAAEVPVIVDCSRDHRHVEGWVYGQPEWAGEALAGATRIAAPGCFATAIALALAPFVSAGVSGACVQVTAATGSTGSGASPSAATHHPLRFSNLKAYKVLTHQHVPEIQAFLGGLGASPHIAFVPLSAPIDRGILATCFVSVSADLDAHAILADAYAHHPGVRVRTTSPELRWVRGTGFCDLSVHQQGDTAVVISAIDNLGRGAAAQALQAACVALQLDPGVTLNLPPQLP